jgi:hypothetical protein
MNLSIPRLLNPTEPIPRPSPFGLFNTTGNPLQPRRLGFASAGAAQTVPLANVHHQLVASFAFVEISTLGPTLPHRTGSSGE